MLSTSAVARGKACQRADAGARARPSSKYAFHACKLLDSSFGSLATRIMGRGKASKLINYDK